MKILTHLAIAIASVTLYYWLREWYPFIVYKLFSRGDL